ncbi:hypothetical protein AmDm5_1654 [Acetobacter malorum]|nr:hypothetical protein AmDm5_1654 [Acetobacter malorum]
MNIWHCAILPGFFFRIFKCGNSDSKTASIRNLETPDSGAVMFCGKCQPRMWHK